MVWQVKKDCYPSSLQGVMGETSWCLLRTVTSNFNARVECLTLTELPGFSSQICIHCIPPKIEMVLPAPTQGGLQPGTTKSQYEAEIPIPVVIQGSQSGWVACCTSLRNLMFLIFAPWYAPNRRSSKRKATYTQTLIWLPVTYLRRRPRLASFIEKECVAILLQCCLSYCWTCISWISHPMTLLLALREWSQAFWNLNSLSFPKNVQRKLRSVVNRAASAAKTGYAPAPEDKSRLENSAARLDTHGRGWQVQSLLATLCFGAMLTWEACFLHGTSCWLTDWEEHVAACWQVFTCKVSHLPHGAG